MEPRTACEIKYAKSEISLQLKMSSSIVREICLSEQNVDGIVYSHYTVADFYSEISLFAECVTVPGEAKILKL